jgi:hypothetical protein
MIAATAVTIGALVVTALFAWFLLAPNWLPVTRDRVERFARRQALPVTAAGGPLLIRYLATTRRWRGGGLLLSVTVTVGVPVLFDVLGPPGVVRSDAVTISFFSLFAGWFAGAVVAEWRINATPAGSRRSASLLRRRLADYTAKRLWVLPMAIWAVLALADLAGIGYLAVAHPADLAPLLLWTGADVVLAAVLLAVGRRVLTRSQRLTRPDVIETDDAIRSRSLHVLAGCTLTIGGYLLTATAYALAPYSSVLDQHVAGPLGVISGLLLPIVGYAIATAPSGPIRRWRRLGGPAQA